MNETGPPIVPVPDDQKVTLSLRLSPIEAKRLDEILVLFQWDRDASNATAHTIRRRIANLLEGDA